MTVKGVDQPEQPLSVVIQSGRELCPTLVPEPGSKIGVEASQGIGGGGRNPVVGHLASEFVDIARKHDPPGFPVVRPFRAPLVDSIGNADPAEDLCRPP